MNVKTIHRLILILVIYSLSSVPIFGGTTLGYVNLRDQSCNTNMYQYTWSLETIDSFGDVGQYTDIAISADNTMFISYYDFGKKDLKCACLMNNDWAIMVVDAEGDVGKCTSLALDTSGHPHICYYDETHRWLKHAYFTGTAWSQEIVDNSGNIGLDMAIAIDAMNKIHISYHDEINGDLMYARSSNNGWEIEVVDSRSDTGEISSLAIDKNDTPHISYTNRYDFALYHAYKVNDNWVSEKVDDISVLYGSTCLTFDFDGFIHILYYDVTPDHFSLKHAYQSTDGWHIEIIDPCLWGTFGTGGANMVFDNQGRIHVGYFNWAVTSVSYAWKINGIWNLEYIDPAWEIPGAGVGAYAALAIDPQGLPAMSYMDMNNLDVKYGHKTNYFPSVPTPPVGTSRGKTGEMYTFTTTSQDLDNDKIQYGWDWNGDLEVDQWTGFYNSGEICEVSHVWNASGSYNIRVIAMDENGFINGYHINEIGLFSIWSNPLPITLPYIPQSINHFFNWWFQRFFDLFQFLH